jgi:AcrR family transcriptional regulator
LSTPEPRPRRTQAERSASTRAALLAAGRELFGQRGFAASGREEIVRRAGVTRGALYHHFADKEDLFRAVMEELEQEVMERVGRAAMQSDDPVEQLRLGAQAYLDAALDPSVSRVCIVDAPAVLPAEVRQEIAERYAHGSVREVLAAIGAAGRIPPELVDALTGVVLSGVMAAAQHVALAERPEDARRDAGAAVDLLITGITTPVDQGQG